MLVIQTSIISPCCNSYSQDEIRISAGGMQESAYWKLLGRFQCASRLYLLSTQQAYDLPIGITTILPQGNNLREVMWLAQGHTAWKSQTSNITPGLLGAPGASFHFLSSQLFIRALAKDAEESGESTKWVIVSSSVVVSQNKSALLFYMTTTMSNRLVPHRLKAYEV